MGEVFEIRVKVENDQYLCDLFTGDGDWYGQTVGKNFGDTFRHGVFLVDPTLAASAWPSDYLEWKESRDTHLK